MSVQPKPPLRYQDQTLYIDDYPCDKLAQEFGTPSYVYSKNQIVEAITTLKNAFQGAPHRIFFAVKACSNIAILQLMQHHHLGFDIVSGGELFRLIAANANTQNVVFSGVGKTDEEIRFALSQSIFSFHVESLEELQRLNHIGESLKQQIPIGLRLNPEVDPKTHPYISTSLKQSKFGIPFEWADLALQRIHHLPWLKLKGLAFHLGSQISSTEPYREAMSKMCALTQTLLEAGIPLEYIDAGGGLGVAYDNQTSYPSTQDWIATLLKPLKPLNLPLHIEPGRWLTASAGFLLTRVIDIKTSVEKSFLIVDAGMNDYLRVALYDTPIEFFPVHQKPHSNNLMTVAGPVCESADVFGDMVEGNAARDVIVIPNTGAYGFSMCSNYNSRCKPAEILIERDKAKIIRLRETWNDLIQQERLLEL